jgi:hypothetical protein
VTKEPVIKIIPNDNKMIDENSFVIIDPGSFSVDSGIIDATIEYTNIDGSVTLSNSYSFNINQRKLDLTHPVNVEGNELKYTKKYSYNEISLKVFYPLDNTINDVTHKLLII